MDKNWSLQAAMEDYQGKNLLREQQELVALLREVQAGYGGILPTTALQEMNISPYIMNYSRRSR